MSKLKHFAILPAVFFLISSCSLVDKIKNKFSEEKNEPKKENTVNSTDSGEKEQTVNNSSSADLEFYNKYIETSNKLVDVGSGLNNSYLENIPAPKSVRKGMILVTVAFDFKVSDAENLAKQLRRSFYDGGELSKLTASTEMKNNVEDSFKTVLDMLESYSKTARQVSDYYHDKQYETDPGKAAGFDEDMKDGYKKFDEADDNFMTILRKYEPKSKRRDVSTISDPDQKSMAVLMNAYEAILEKAQDFYSKFKKIDRTADLSGLQKDMDDLEAAFNKESGNVESTSFTDKTKSLKYNFEDYFSKSMNDFIKHSRKFLSGGSNMKEAEFTKGYNDVVEYYNYMINAYNSSMQTLNTMQQYY